MLSATKRGAWRLPRLLGLAVLALLSAGCVRREAAAAPGVVRLRAWTMWGGGESAAFQVVLDQFNSTHPGIRVENLAAVADDKTIRAIVANDPPELFTLRDPSYLGSLAANGALQPLDDEFRASGLQAAEFAPGTLSQCRYHGRLYAMIYLTDCAGLLWNRDSFAEAGVTRPPQTLEELLNLAQRLTKRNSAGQIERLGMMPPDPLMVISVFGGQFVDPSTGLPTADTPRNRMALSWYRDLIRAQGTPEEVNAFRAGFGEEQGINNPFLMDKVAMMFNGEWNPYWFQRYGPRVRYGAGAVPYPAAYPGLRGSTFLGGNLFCLPAGGRHRREAWEFLRWTQTLEAQALFASTIHGVPNLIAALKSPSLRQGEPWKQWFAVFLDIADSPNARHFPVTPVSGLYQSEITTAADYVRFGERTPEAALADVQARVMREARQWQ